MDKFSYVGNADVNAIEELFTKFQKDPSSVDQSWQDFFKGFEFARVDYTSNLGDGAVSAAMADHITKEFRVVELDQWLPYTRTFIYKNKSGAHPPKIQTRPRFGCI